MGLSEKTNLIERAKKAAGEAAAEMVENDMVVGLGTGTTASYFIKRLVKRCREGLKIRAVATSQHSLAMAEQGGIPVLDINTIATLDLDVDGADEIDTEKRMIKGGGGALVRERIIASMSHEMIVIVDYSKLVPRLGHFPLAIEILPFGSKAAVAKINRLGYQGKMRKTSDAHPYITDNGNFIFDINFPHPPDNPEEIHASIKSVPGVIDTGFFFGLAGRVVMGCPDGTVQVFTNAIPAPNLSGGL